MKILDYDIEDFIGIFQTDCQTEVFIDYFESMRPVGKFFHQSNSENGFFQRAINAGQSRYRNDEQVYILHDTRQDSTSINYQQIYDGYVDLCLGIYAREHNNFFRNSYDYRYIEARKIQKTNPGGGFHQFHSEWEPSSYSRCLVTLLYLNDVKEGGETEFIFQKKRISPKRGNMIIFPTCWTHSHRGNPPLKEDKYIMTSWVSDVTEVK